MGLAARDLDHLAVHWDVHRPQLVLVKSLLVNFAALHLAPQERPPVVCGVDTYPHTPPGAREWDVVRPDSSGVSMRESARSTCTRPAPVTTTPWLNPAPMHVIFSWRSSSFRPARGTAALYQYVSPSPTWPRSPLPHVNARPSAVAHTRMSHNTRPHAHTRLVCAHEAVRAASNAPAERPRLPRTCQRHRVRKAEAHVDNVGVVQPLHTLPIPHIVLGVAHTTLAKCVASHCVHMPLVCAVRQQNTQVAASEVLPRREDWGRHTLRSPVMPTVMAPTEQAAFTNRTSSLPGNGFTAGSRDASMLPPDTRFMNATSRGNMPCSQMNLQRQEAPVHTRQTVGICVETRARAVCCGCCRDRHKRASSVYLRVLLTSCVRPHTNNSPLALVAALCPLYETVAHTQDTDIRGRGRGGGSGSVQAVAQQLVRAYQPAATEVTSVPRSEGTGIVLVSSSYAPVPRQPKYPWPST